MFRHMGSIVAHETTARELDDRGHGSAGQRLAFGVGNHGQTNVGA